MQCSHPFGADNAACRKAVAEQKHYPVEKAHASCRDYEPTGSDRAGDFAMSREQDNQRIIDQIKGAPAKEDDGTMPGNPNVKPMCNCIDEVNENLAPHNTTLCINLLHRPHPVMVSTTKIREKVRGKPILVQATFCPFCGEKYDSKSIFRDAAHAEDAGD